MSILDVDLGPVGDSLEAGLLDRLELDRESLLMDEAEEAARPVIMTADDFAGVRLARLDAQAGPPPF